MKWQGVIAISSRKVGPRRGVRPLRVSWDHGIPSLLVVFIVIAALGGSSPAAEDGEGALAPGWGEEELGPLGPLDIIDLIEDQGGALERNALHSSRASGPPGPAQGAGAWAASSQVKYIFDWGDGTVSETGFVDPRTVVNLSHIWDRPGVYSVRVRAEDVYGASSQWSCAIDVTITERVNRFVGLRRQPVS